MRLLNVYFQKNGKTNYVYFMLHFSFLVSVLLAPSFVYSTVHASYNTPEKIITMYISWKSFENSLLFNYSGSIDVTYKHEISKTEAILNLQKSLNGNNFQLYAWYPNISVSEKEHNTSFSFRTINLLLF